MPPPEPLYTTTSDTNSGNYSHQEAQTIVCRICNIAKPLSNFTKNKRNRSGYETKCRECAGLYSKELDRRHAQALASAPLPTEKTCLMCNKTKPIERFYKAGWSADGRHSRCRDCIALLAAEEWRRNPRPPEINRRKNKEWREANKEYVALKKAIRYEENRAKMLEKSRDRHKKEDPARRRALQRTWNHKHWERHATQNCRARARRKGVPFNMVPSDLFTTEGKLPEFCPIFPSIRLRYDGGPDRRVWPSVDRIVPELGYVTGNVWVTSLAANMWKNNGSSPVERRKIIALMRSHKPTNTSDSQGDLFG